MGILDARGVRSPGFFYLKNMDSLSVSIETCNSLRRPLSYQLNITTVSPVLLIYEWICSVVLGAITIQYHFKAALSAVLVWQ